ncbi:sodium-coupled monocarboxylate transporter 2-like isoform X2 [Lycorma delicatula]|uniref:sodium-coupled monocarboxylate transporter 2-like isoform X2 n=1 Tax=Lycorma delicatula TaxID=130591 RepID=UPI003F50D886
MPTFSWFEHLVILFTIVLPVLIGLYFGFCKNNKLTPTEYNIYTVKTSSVILISLSLIASHVSGTTLLEIPSEIYVYGTQYYAVIFSYVIVTIFILQFYLPVFYQLELNSPYEYLERRFHYSVRLLTSLLYLTSFILNLLINVHFTALAIHKVSGTPLNVAAAVIYIISINNNILGGFKAVIWTQAWQIIFILYSIIVILEAGCISAGGLTNVIEINKHGQRFEIFNMDVDPFSRNTFWAVVYGLTFQWLAKLAIHPVSIQRITAVPTNTDAKIVIISFTIGTTLITSFACFIGLLIYTKYHNCDPLNTKEVEMKEQLFPHYILDLAGQYPSLTCLFISVMISAAVSETSAYLNTTSTIIYEDFIIKCFKKYIKEKNNSVKKIINITLGTLFIIFVFLAEANSSILQIAKSLKNVTNGALIFVFSFGMMFPWGTSKGAVAGLIVCLITSYWIMTGSQFAINEGKIKLSEKIRSIKECQESSFKSTVNSTQSYEGRDLLKKSFMDDSVPELFRISPLYHTIISSLLGLVTALFVSFITGMQDLNKLNPNLIVPQLRKVITERQRISNENREYELVALT